MQTIKERIHAHRAAMLAVQESVNGFANAQIALKKTIAHGASKEITFSVEECDGLSKEQIMDKFHEAVEEQLETTERPSNTSKLMEIIARRKAEQAHSDDLSIESDDYIELEDEEDSTVLSYQEIHREEVKKQEELTKQGKQESFSLSITLNAKQMMAKELAFAGKSFCLIGPAGSGKTTAARAVASALLESGELTTSNFKNANSVSMTDKRVVGPSMAFVAYTRRATANLAKAIWKDPFLKEALANNMRTIHALLEYEPEEYYDYVEEKQKFRFAPKRTATNPLDITHLVIEEASMLDAIVLWEKLYDALPIGVQIIFIGDINQLPPVFGPSILNYALIQLPIVELTETYRNQGIVLDNAHHILKGEEIEEDNNYRVVRGKEPFQQSQSNTMRQLKVLFERSFDTIGDDGFPEYDPEDCIILSPFNKHDLGTDNINKHIAQFLGDKRDAIVYEVIAGFAKVYLAVGDRVMFNKRDADIISIKRNPSYHGREPQMEGADLSRHGFRILGKHAAMNFDEDDFHLNYDTFSVDEIEKEGAERKQQASHIVTIKYDGEELTEELKSAGDFGSQVFSLGYCLTVHKAQGSEWRKVFLILHKEHAVMLFRELFYTAATRARTKVTIIAKDATIAKAIKNQRIKGNTLADKLEFFNSGIDQLLDINCIKI